MQKKNGNITYTLTFVISLAFLTVFTIYVINTIIPFVWYQKLQTIANKYVYVIEKFGYLTQSEENELYNQLQQEGFKIENIHVEFPKAYLEYGTLFKFEITYDLYQEYNIIGNGVKKEARVIPLRIRKYGYSKI